MRLLRPLLVAVLLAGCSGGADERQLPALPTAGPAPVPTVDPAGRVLPLEGTPRGLVVLDGGALVAVATTAPDRVELVDPVTLTVRTSVALGAAPRALAADTGGTLLVATDEGLVRVPGGDAPRPTDAEGGTPLVDVAAAGAYTVVVGSDGTVRTTGPSERTDDDLVGPVAVAALGDDRVAVVDGVQRGVTVAELESGDRGASGSAGEGPVDVAAVSDDRFVVVDAGDQAVLLFDTGPLSLRQRLPLRGRPYGLATDPADGSVWVTLSATNEVVGFATRTGALREFDRLATVRQPELVAVGGTVVAVASPTTRELVVVER